MRYVLILIITLFATTCAWANISNDNHRYKQTQFEIKNNTTHLLTIEFTFFEGVWKKPVAPKASLMLKPQETYQNTLLSVERKGGLESFASFAVSQVDNPRNNYLIYAADSSSHRQSVTSDIFDGLGDMFVDSRINHCDDTTSEGYADCKLIVQSRS